MEVGIKGNREIVVTKDMLASRAGSGTVDVFSTPVMVAEIERTAAISVMPFLEEGRVTVGTKVNVAHTAATPEGKKVYIQTELVEISSNGKMLTFTAEVRDDKGSIGNGTHERAIIHKERFMEKLKTKYTD